MLAVKGASVILAVEQLSEEELCRLHARYVELAARGERPPPQVLDAARPDRDGG
jgi:hypothetical protein